MHRLFLYIVPLKQGLKHSLTDVTSTIGEPVFIHSSIKTRIETNEKDIDSYLLAKVFIHSSIKTRIETASVCVPAHTANEFLYIVPLKQGLKRRFPAFQARPRDVFIHSSIKTRIETVIMRKHAYLVASVFIHSSIKTRIETTLAIMVFSIVETFLYIVPLKQGLKQKAIF